MIQDHPHIRAARVCPLCGGSTKPIGNVCCWPCYRTQGLRYGNPAAELVIEAREVELIQEARS